MNTFIRNWHITFLALLTGFLALTTGVSAQAYVLIANASASSDLTGTAPWTPNLNNFASTCTSPQNYPCQTHWNFGDGTISNPADDLTSPNSGNHTYKFGGVYTVTMTMELMVPGGNGPKSSTTLTVNILPGESLNTYVSTCKQQLAFSDADVAAIASNLNCNKGVLFAPSTNVINDYFGYARINDNVDLAFACRWANNPGTGITTPPFIHAVSIELIINNHQNGNTCFFQASTNLNGSTKDVSTAIVSPTAAAVAAPNTPEADFWNVPIELDRHLICVNCHVAGPYIATPRIAPFLAQFGLLNNGHDTYGRYLDMNNQPAGNFHVVGSTFAHFNDTALTNNVPVGNTCTLGCHSIGYNSGQGDVNGALNGSIDVLLPGIINVIDQGGIVSDTGVSVITSGAMRPYADDSAYRWINRDNPGSDGIDIETFTASKNTFPVSQFGCGVPTVLEAHTVGSTANFSTTDMAKLPDKLSVFNAREGLICLTSDQPGGRQCNNYSVKYQCSDGSWSGVYDVDSPTFGGDYEVRSNQSNVCTSKPGLTAIAIQATTTVNGNTTVVNGPADRLAQFSPTGLICKNADQPNGGQCSNYVVRYRSCTASSQAYLARLKNVWTNPPTFTDRYLTTTNNVSGAETRAQANNYQYPSQDWIVETLSGTTVRLKDVWSGKYLTASSTNDLAPVIVQNSNASLTLQQWVIETASGSNTEKQLKNVGSGRYLTVGNYTTDPYYAPVISQALSNQNWTSQRWVIQ